MWVPVAVWWCYTANCYIPYIYRLCSVLLPLGRPSCCSSLDSESASTVNLVALLSMNDTTAIDAFTSPVSVADTLPWYTHPFNGPFCGTTQVRRYQKGKTNLDFTGARDSEWQWHQLGMCKSAPRSRQITMPAPHHSVFYRPDALPGTRLTASKHWRC